MLDEAEITWCCDDIWVFSFFLLIVEGVKVLLRAIEIYIDMGRFTIAAKHHISIAEIYENEMVDLEKSVENYERAADYYKGEESNR